jgi:hypothetical protein
VSLATQAAGCFIGAGTDNTGSGGAAATWSAAGDCTRPTPVGGKKTDGGQKPELDRSGQLLDVAVGADGWMVAAGRTRTDFTALQHRLIAGRGLPAHAALILGRFDLAGRLRVVGRTGSLPPTLAADAGPWAGNPPVPSR